MRLFYFEGFAETLNHSIGIGALSALKVADHILPNAKLFGELGLRETRLQASAGQEIADPVLLHFPPVLSTFDGDILVCGLFREYRNLVPLLNPVNKFAHMLAVERNLNISKTRQA